MQLAAGDDGVVEHRSHRCRQRLGAVDEDQHGPGNVQGPVAQAHRQVGHQSGVLGRALHYSQSVPMPMPMPARWSTKFTPSTMSATKSSPESSPGQQGPPKKRRPGGRRRVGKWRRSAL